MKKALLTTLYFLAFTISIHAETASSNKVIVFDFGGVIVHPDKDRAVFYAFIQDTFHFDKAALQKIRDAFEFPRKAKFPEIPFWQQIAEKYQISLPSDWKDRYDSAVLKSLNESKEMRHLIKFYKERGIQVALLSNVTAEHAAFLRSYGLYEDFSPVLLSCEIGVDKPDPRSFQILLSEIKTLPENCIFIDDKKENIDAAKALGIDAIQFLNAEQVSEALKIRFLSN